jgi:hypothetical protein
MANDMTFEFRLSNAPSSTFTVLSATNLSFPLSEWKEIGVATNAGPGSFKFTDPSPATSSQRFYRLRLP